MSRQRILPSGNFEKRPHQKKHPNIQRRKHKHENQIRLCTPHQKQEYHQSPENEIEPNGNVIGWSSGSLRRVSSCGVGSCDAPYGVNKDAETEEKGGESAAGG